MSKTVWNEIITVINEILVILDDLPYSQVVKGHNIMSELNTTNTYTDATLRKLQNVIRFMQMNIWWRLPSSGESVSTWFNEWINDQYDLMDGYTWFDGFSRSPKDEPANTPEYPELPMIDFDSCGFTVKGEYGS